MCITLHSKSSGPRRGGGRREKRKKGGNSKKMRESGFYNSSISLTQAFDLRIARVRGGGELRGKKKKREASRPGVTSVLISFRTAPPGLPTKGGRRGGGKERKGQGMLSIIFLLLAYLASLEERVKEKGGVPRASPLASSALARRCPGTFRDGCRPEEVQKKKKGEKLLRAGPRCPPPPYLFHPGFSRGEKEARKGEEKGGGTSFSLSNRAWEGKEKSSPTRDGHRTLRHETKGGNPKKKKEKGGGKGKKKRGH